MAPGDFADCRRAWLAGRCPCCSGDICEWENHAGVVFEPAAIAEGVMMCGRCIGEHHHEAAEFLPLLLQSLLPS